MKTPRILITYRRAAEKIGREVMAAFRRLAREKATRKRHPAA